MKLPEIKSGMNALILGYGASGNAAQRLLEKLNVATTVLEGDKALPKNISFDFAITSPGIPLDHKWQKECGEKRIPVASELSLASRFWRGRIIAVTGSKGKSSVVKLLADTFNLAGRRAIACGNYGVPFCDVAFNEHKNDDWAIVEVSSFQMETTEKEDFHPELAATINFQEDHLDRHGCVETYHEYKLKLLESSALGYVPLKAKAITSYGILEPHEMRGNILEAQELPDDFFSGSYFGNPILKKNAECAVALMRKAGISDDFIIAGLKNFKPLPHRMCVIGEYNNIRFIDDSKATSLSALAAAVKMEESRNPIRLIAGGLAKGDNPKIIIKDLSKSVKKVYLIGCCAKQFFEAWNKDVPCEICETLDRAVDAALRDVRTGETILLSPGTASFDQFKSYGARGDMFASLVRARVGGLSGASQKEDEKI
jgi:UDP-N-acetylmuramoylalanine--D-glutamate ligase